MLEGIGSALAALNATSISERNAGVLGVLESEGITQLTPNLMSHRFAIQLHSMTYSFVIPYSTMPEGIVSYGIVKRRADKIRNEL